MTTSSLIKTLHTTMSPSCTTGTSPPTRMNPSPLSPPKSQSSTILFSSTLISARWTPSGSPGCTTAVCICCHTGLQWVEFFFKNLTAIGLCKTHSYVHTPPLILIQPGRSPCWISVPLSMQAFVGWSRPLMMWSVSTLRALQAHWITHSWGNAEVWIMSLHVYCNFRGN